MLQNNIQALGFELQALAHASVAIGFDAERHRMVIMRAALRSIQDCIKQFYGDNVISLRIGRPQ